MSGFDSNARRFATTSSVPSAETAPQATGPEADPERGIRTAHPFRMWDAVLETPEAIRHCLEPQVQERILETGKMIAQRGISRIFLLGCGTSKYAAISTARALVDLAGMDADAYDSLEFASYGLGRITPQTAVMAFSHSGNTKATVDAAALARARGAFTICLTDTLESRLAENADIVVPVGGGPEPVEPKTRSYINTVVVGYLLAAGAALKSGESAFKAAADESGVPNPIAVDGQCVDGRQADGQCVDGRYADARYTDGRQSMRGCVCATLDSNSYCKTGLPLSAPGRGHAAFGLKAVERASAESQQGALSGELARIPALLTGCLSLESQIKALAGKHKDAKRVFTVGAGPNYATALEVALKFREAVLLPAEGLEVEEAFHGPIASLDEDTLVIAVTGPGPSSERVGDFAQAAALMGCPVIRVIAEPDRTEAISGSTTGTTGVATNAPVSPTAGRDCRMPGVGFGMDGGLGDAIRISINGLRETFSNSVLIYPLYMLAYYSALLRGNNPDVFRHGDTAFRKAISSAPSISYRR